MNFKIPGDTGSRGPSGPVGARGPSGLQGEPGRAGVDGPTGMRVGMRNVCILYSTVWVGGYVGGGCIRGVPRIWEGGGQEIFFSDLGI